MQVHLHGENGDAGVGQPVEEYSSYDGEAEEGERGEGGADVETTKNGRHDRHDRTAARMEALGATDMYAERDAHEQQQRDEL